MTFIKKLLEYLEPQLYDLSPTIGEWSEKPEDDATRFLSINYDGGLSPGVASVTPMVRLLIVSSRDEINAPGGRMGWAVRAEEFLSYIRANPVSSCFASIIPIAGIIGPQATTEGRLVYQLTLELTY
jgi:hypothetical protein